MGGGQCWRHVGPWRVDPGVYTSGLDGPFASGDPGGGERGARRVGTRGRPALRWDEPSHDCAGGLSELADRAAPKVGTRAGLHGDPQRGWPAKKVSTCSRLSCLRNTTAPDAVAHWRAEFDWLG